MRELKYVTVQSTTNNNKQGGAFRLPCDEPSSIGIPIVFLLVKSTFDIRESGSVYRKMCECVCVCGLYARARGFDCVRMRTFV